MKLTVTDTTQIDSNCSRRVTRPETPATVAPRCRADATTWVVSPKGSRRYICEDHAREVLRFLDVDAEADATPVDRLPDHPTVRPCAGCGKLTRREDFAATNTCPECADARTRADELVTVEEGDESDTTPTREG